MVGWHSTNSQSVSQSTVGAARGARADHLRAGQQHGGVAGHKSSRINAGGIETDSTCWGKKELDGKSMPRSGRRGGGGGAAYAQRNYLPRQRSEAAGERARRRTAWSENRYVISEEEKEPSE